jgi:hypothetical protein
MAATDGRSCIFSNIGVFFFRKLITACMSEIKRMGQGQINSLILLVVYVHLNTYLSLISSS